MTARPSKPPVPAQTRTRVHALVTAFFVAAVMVVLIGCGSTAQPSTAKTTVAGYLVPWDTRSTVGDGGGVLTEVNPVWFQPTDAGGLAFASTEARDSVAPIETDAESHHIMVEPTISNFRNNRWDGELIARIITDPTLRAAHINAITNLIRSNGWSSIGLDYESMPAASRDAYSAFVHDLVRSIHQAGGQLTVALHAKTSEPGDWSGAQAQDWRALGASADQVKVMAYDYSSAESPPGAVAPPQWVDQVLTLARSLAPTNKIVLGLPTYGYDWRAGQPGEALQWADVQQIARTRGVPQRWDAKTSSPWLQYTDEQGRGHTVWYEDARSVAAKVAVAKGHGITHVAIWRLGGEDPGVWDSVRAIQ